MGKKVDLRSTCLPGIYLPGRIVKARGEGGGRTKGNRATRGPVEPEREIQKGPRLPEWRNGIGIVDH